MPLPWKSVAIGSAVLGVIGIAVLASRGRTAETAAAQRQRVALIGDSYAVGLGPELRKILPEFMHEGVVGASTGFWSHKIPADERLRAFQPTLVLVSLGVNDGAPRQADYSNVVRALHGLGARVVWIEPPAGVRTAARGAIAAAGVETIPATSTPLAADNLHPRSYAGWAGEIARALGAA